MTPGTDVVRFRLHGDEQRIKRFFYLLSAVVHVVDPRFASASTRGLLLVCLTADIPDVAHLAAALGLGVEEVGRGPLGDDYT